MDRFIFVKPAAAGWNPAVDAWVKSEMDRAVREWRRQFRGDVIVKDAAAVTDADIAQSNLILWGDPQSNPLLAKATAKLPIEWTKESVKANGKTYPRQVMHPYWFTPTR
jgi:hypothetical protein